MQYLRDNNIENKKVILRLDLNVTIKENRILDDTKIIAALPTINYLLNKGNHILIMSHLGRIKTNEDKNNNSLLLVSKRLEELLNQKVNFINKTKGQELEESILNNEITLMENTRFEDLNNKAESTCDMELSKYWANLGEVFINDAFATTHRRHASNYGISKYLKTYIGFLIEKELKGLEPIIKVEKRPFIVLMGGSKVDDKIKLIESILKNCDYLLVGGGIANTFIYASGLEIGNSLYSPDYIENIKELLKEYKNKIIIPIDYIVERNNKPLYIRKDEIINTDIIYDIGKETIELYTKYITESNLLFINGTVGLYENELYEEGTKKVLESLSKTNGIKIVGGGDALASINKFNYQKYATYISTGGGATLEYIANKKLECFEE